jgi:uncharacterized protein (TIGR03435 family)
MWNGRPRTGRKLTRAIAAILAAAGPTVVEIEHASLGRAQSLGGAEPVAFEVASIKPSAVWRTGGEGSSRSRIEHSPESLTMRNVDLSDCVQWAYKVKFFQIGGTKALDAERYDILAKTAAPVSIDDLRRMLQDLLAQRFKLVLHRDTKLLPVYELVVAKRGRKLPAAKATVDMTLHAAESLPRVEDGSFIFQETSMAEFAEKLSQLRGIDRPVVDRTGIQGYFDITLKSAASAILDDSTSLFGLVEEQLGLKLAPARAAFEVLVIDHAEKPSAN